MKTKKIIIISVFTALMLLVALTSCANTTTSTTTTIAASSTTTKAVSPLTDQELQKLLSDAVSASKDFTTYRYDINMVMKMTVDGESAPGNIALKMNGALDMLKPAIELDMEMTVPDDSGDPQNQKVLMYLIDKTMYIKMNVPGVGEQWIKTTATEELMKTFDVNMMNEQWDAFASPESIEYVKEESSNGVSCYVLKIIPTSEYLRKYAEQNASQGLKIDWDKVKDIMDLYKDMVFQVWITKDSKQIIKMTTTSTMIFTDDYAQSSDMSFDKITMDIDMTAELFDQGKPIDLTLPAEAENAVELAPEALLGN